MGFFRTVFAEVPCNRCGTKHRNDVQFKTHAGDHAMNVYEEGDVVDDLDDGDVFEGIADRYCPECVRARVRAQIESTRDALLALARREAELVVVVHGDIEAAFAPLIDEGRASRIGDPWLPGLPAELDVYVPDGAEFVREWPVSTDADVLGLRERPFWRELERRAWARFDELGWGCEWLDVAVRIVRDPREPTDPRCVDRVRVDVSNAS